MKKNEEKEIEEFIYELGGDDFEGKLEDVALIFTDTVNWVRKRLPEHLYKLPALDKAHRFIIKHRYGYNDESDSFELCGVRWETDEEFKKRIETSKKASISAKKSAKVRAEKEKEEEKALYEKLKKTYG